MNPEALSKTSKQLSWLLRHGAPEAGVPVDPAGWAPIDAVLRALNIDRATLDAVVQENNKQRLQVREGMVRACQGHSKSMPVTLDALEASWELVESTESVWHGTAIAVLAQIAREGLLPIDRTHVHLAQAPDSSVGKRSNVAVLLEVSPTRLHAEGLRLYRSPNGVILVRHVPPRCITGLQPLTRAARERAAELRALFA